MRTGAKAALKSHLCNLATPLRTAWDAGRANFKATIANAELPLFFICLVIGGGILPHAVGLATLILQQAVQTYLVYKSTASERTNKRDRLLLHDPSTNMLRSVAGTLLLALVDVGLPAKLADMLGERTVLLSVSRIVWHSFVGYWTIVVSEYMVHRFVWHGHWMRHSNNVPRLFNFAHFHYMQHYLVHHKHAVDPDTKARMQEGISEPHDADKKRSIETQLKSHVGDLENKRSIEKVLACSNHGFTIGTWKCWLTTVMLYFIGPTGFSIIMHAVRNDLLGASVHLLSTLCSVYMAVQHHAFHSSHEARVRWAKGRVWFERWFWMSEAMFCKTEEHKLHHYAISEHSDTSFCGALPYGHLILFPMWQTW